MEHEVQQEGLPLHNKQAFIYKKNATSTAKAITRKMRQSQIPPALNQQNSTGDSAGFPQTSASKLTMEASRQSQQEVETIATGHDQSGHSERAQALSQGNFNRLDSEVIATAEVFNRPPDNRRFHTGHKSKNSHTNKFATYYEDNIDSETEVFIDPEFETKMDMPRNTADDARNRRAARELFSNTSNEDSNSFQQQQRPHMTAPSPSPMNQEDHFKAIDAVINSNVDDRTKKLMIADIQDTYRRSQGDAGRTEPSGMYKPRNQKTFKDTDDYNMPDEKPKRKKRNNRAGTTVQDSIDFKPQKLADVPSKGGKKTARKQPKKSGKNNETNPQSDQLQQNHDQMLMPEMNGFMDDDIGQRNYMTQDEMPNSRLAQLGMRNTGTDDSDDDLVNAKLAQFTPGRIRASKMDFNGNGKRNNFVKSPTTTGTTLDFLNATPINQKPRATTRPNRKTKVENVDDQSSLQDEDNYNNLLPAVKVQRKRKKLSPASASNKGESVMYGHRNNHPSQSRMSNSGLRKPVQTKLRPTLDQGVHYNHVNVSVPKKQTNFYDDKHQSAITDQQIKGWNVKNNTVMLDEFHSGKKKVPTNRHRIPAVGEDPLNSVLERNKTQISPKTNFLWDMDGRKQIKPKKQPQRVITSNASLHKVDLPRINPNATKTNILSPKGTFSQPAGVGKPIHTQSFGGPQQGKFVSPNDSRLKPTKPQAPELNTQSNNGPLYLVDIDIKPNQIDPQSTLHEPPINYPAESPSPSLNYGPDYDCPVCHENVKGRDTAPHSRTCRTAPCRFCEFEFPLLDLEKHEKHCNEPVRCRFCNIDFPEPDIQGHEADCNELVRCRICRNEYPMRDLYEHENNCNEPAKCRGCKISFPQQDIDRHEAQCIESAKCRFCRVEYQLEYLDDHEARCNQPAKCPACKYDFPRNQYPDHLNKCPQLMLCKFCKVELLPKDVDSHEMDCNEPQQCTFCLKDFLRKIIPKHESTCQGIEEEPEVDNKPYQDKVEKKRSLLQRKSTGKVLVEDDFVNPKDSKDSGSRKNNRHESNEAKTNRQKSIKKLLSQASMAKPPRTVSDRRDFISQEILSDKKVNETSPVLLSESQRSQERLNHSQTNGPDQEKLIKSQVNSSSKIKSKLSEERLNHSQANGTDQENLIKNQVNGSSQIKSKLSIEPPVSRSYASKPPKSPAQSANVRRQSGITNQIASQSYNLRSMNNDEPRDSQRQTSPLQQVDAEPHISQKESPPLQQEPHGSQKESQPLQREPYSSQKESSPLQRGILKEGSKRFSQSPDQVKSSSKHSNKEQLRVSDPKHSNTEEQRKEASKDSNREEEQREDEELDIQTKSGQHELRPQIEDSRSAAYMSEDRRHDPNMINDGRMLIASLGYMHPPKTELGGDQEDSIVKGTSPEQNGRYDIQSMNEKLSGLDKSPDLSNVKLSKISGRDKSPDLSNVKLSKKLNSSNNESTKIKQEQGKDISSNHGTDAAIKLNKTVKSQNTTSQVRFAYGTGASYDNGDQRLRTGVDGKVNSSQRLNSQQKLEYEQFSQNLPTNLSMQTRVKEVTEDDKKLLAIQQQVSVKTQETRSGVGPNKILKQPTDHSTNYDFPQQENSRIATTQGGNRKKMSTTSTKKSIKRANTNDLRSRDSNASKSNISNGIYIADDKSKSRSRSFGRSNTSKSPHVQRVMEKLTHHRVKIDQQTKLLINGSEVLSSQGISGSISKVGVGFGTGRHAADAAGRKLDLYKESTTQAIYKESATQAIYKQSSTQVQHNQSSTQAKYTESATQAEHTQTAAVIKRIVPGERILPSEPIEVPESLSPAFRAQSPPNHRQPIRLDAETQNYYPDVMSEGCDPILKSVKSQMISAHLTQNDVCLSARTQTVRPEKENIALSARPLSEVSMREQGDQITEGRFEPTMVDTCINTGTDLLENYLYKPKIDSGMMTSPIIFGDKKPIMVSAQQQTEPMISYLFVNGEEPKFAIQAHEPETNIINLETGSQSSVLEEPMMDKVCELVMQSEYSRASEVEDPYIDDWVETSLYRYAYSMHYERMVSKRLISVQTTKRPEVSSKQEGMTQTQRYEYNLNPENLEILTQMECDYAQSALRHKTATYRNEDMLTALYTKTKTTIEVLNANMVSPDITDHILFQHYEEVTKKNVIKLLIRTKRLYDARNESVNILNLAMEVDAVIQPKSDLWRIMQDNSGSALIYPYSNIIDNTLKMLSNAMTIITIYQQEHRLFKNKFKFNGEEYCDHICDIGKIIGGFLRHKNEPNPALQANGQLQEEHTEHTMQSERYNQWVESSLEEYGRLDLPDKSQIELTLQLSERPSKKHKVSRIDRALKKLREEQRERSEASSARLDLTMTNKSRILEQMQLKSDKLQILQQNSTSVRETSVREECSPELQKTLISDQMLERKQQSVTKRERIVREQEERRIRHLDGYITPDENEKKANVTFAGSKLLKQQMLYDGDMESQTTMNHKPMTISQLQQKPMGPNNRYFGSQLSGLAPQMQDSIISSKTSINMVKKQPFIVSGQFQDYQQMPTGKFDFAASTNLDQPSLGQAYDEPKTMIPNLRGGRNQMHASHAGLMLDRSPDKINRGDEYEERSVFYVGGNQIKSNVAPSEQTTVPNLLNMQQRNTGMAHMEGEEEDMENATEFTEQIDDAEHIALETGQSVMNLVDSADQMEDLTVMGALSHLPENGLTIINQGEIKIKYQSNTPTNLTPEKNESLLNDSSAEPDSVNERQ